MRGFVVALLVARGIASADVVAIPTTSKEVVAVPLDALGWAVEAKVALDARDAHASIEVTDDRRMVHVDILNNLVSLEGEQFLVDLTGTHAIRVEASGARRLVLVDGQVVLDHDYGLPDMVVDAPRGVRLTSNPRETLRWLSVSADTAPEVLAHSLARYEPATHFAGPFAPWLMAWAQRERPRREELAAVVLPEAARMCVAFAFVAAASRAPRPKHFRLVELKQPPPPGARTKIPERARPDLFEEPQLDMSPFELRRTDYALSAQGELRKALVDKVPESRLQRAIDAAITAQFPADATNYLLAQLAVLAKHPAACR